MKNISILRTIRIILAIVFIIQLVSLFFGKRFGESEATMFRIASTALLGLVLILVFAFGKKFEQEKIERERRNQTPAK
jgi:uncharacterized YccA/Bax inhibitor family protein